MGQTLTAGINRLTG